MRWLISASAAVVALAPTLAMAHPHVLIDAKSELVFEAGKLTAVRHIWQFDTGFTAFAVQGLDSNNDGKISDAELEPLAKVNVEALSMFGFFTRLTVNGRDTEFVPPTEYWIEIRNGRLTLFYSLPLAAPVAVNGTATMEVADPEYFVGFNYVANAPITLDGAPAGCTATLRPPQPIDASTMALLSAVPIDQATLPPALRSAASALANKVSVTCP